MKLKVNEMKEKTEKDIELENAEQYIKELLKQARKLFNRQSKYMRDNNQTTEGLLYFLGKQPEVFAAHFGIIERDMLKWALQTNINHNNALIDRIKEIEAEYNLPLHGIDDCD